MRPASLRSKSRKAVQRGRARGARADEVRKLIQNAPVVVNRDRKAAGLLKKEVERELDRTTRRTR